MLAGLSERGESAQTTRFKGHGPVISDPSGVSRAPGSAEPRSHVLENGVVLKQRRRPTAGGALATLRASSPGAQVVLPTFASDVPRAQPEPAGRVERPVLELGNAIAQPYHHAILPLSTRRDKVTEVRWGIADFRRRFGRDPEGMWLPETALDDETLDVLAQEGMRFTIVAPGQVKSVPNDGHPGRYTTANGRTAHITVLAARPDLVDGARDVVVAPSVPLEVAS